MKRDRLPPGLEKSLTLLPTDTPIACLIRHAEREPFILGDLGNDVDITTQGQASCQLLATLFSNQVNKIYSSPVKRCLQTAHSLAISSMNKEVTLHSFLGDPGIFITDPAKAHCHFLQQDVIDIVKYLLQPVAANPPGFCVSTYDAVIRLIQFMLDKATLPGLHLFVTHDAILSPVLGYWFKDATLETLWPDYLEGLFIWQSSEAWHGVYRDSYLPLLMK